MKIPLFLFAMLALTAGYAAAADLSTNRAYGLTNEAGTLRFTLWLDTNGLGYTVDRVEQDAVTTLLERSPLGLTRTDLDLSHGLIFIGASEPIVVEDNYQLVTGRQRETHSRGRERVFHLETTTHVRLDVVVRAYRDGIAFRYALPGGGSQMYYVSDEATGFKLPPGSRVWAQPYSKVDVWAPGYEADYVNGAPVGTAAPGAEGWALPLLSQHGHDWVLITESGLEPSYFAVHLQPTADQGMYRVRLPEEGETYGVAPQAATITLPWTSPWRVVIVADHAGGVVESTLVTDLARPSEQIDVSWIHPGVSSWSWWSDMPSPADYTKLVPFVDVAAKLHWRYSLLDLGWDRMAHGGDLAALVRYADAKGVGLTVWYNSAGAHNHVPDTSPRDRVNDAVVREAEFARLEALGIKGVKIDFMQSDKQYVIALYHDILRAAARHHLIVDFHGCTLPTGWQRTYPNLVSMEAVRGAEQYWDKTFAENAQTLNTIYVFTRNAVGSMDYTPTILANPNPPYEQRVPHLTTNAHELALPVVFESGVTHIADSASSLMAQPIFVQDYLTDLPTAWDESRVLAGEPGQLAVLARRSRTAWYVAGINGRKTPQRVDIALSFLAAGSYDLSLITDGDSASSYQHTTRTANAADRLTINLAGRGGFVARLRPSTKP